MSHMQFIYEDFVRPTDWKALVVANKILLVTERDWGSWVKIEQLLHVEDLDTVSLRLAANDHKIIVATDLAPGARNGVCW
jgi:hypothetical protein